MGRLKTGVEPLDPAVRRKSYRKNLVNEGGARLLLELDKPANDAIIAISQHLACSKKQAASQAFLELADRLGLGEKKV